MNGPVVARRHSEGLRGATPERSPPIAHAIGAFEQIFGAFEQIFGANRQEPARGRKRQRSGDGGAATFGALAKLANGKTRYWVSAAVLASTWCA